MIQWNVRYLVCKYIREQDLPLMSYDQFDSDHFSPYSYNDQICLIY